MRKLFLSLLLFGCAQAFAQQSTLSGRVVDTLEKKDLQHAVVSLLRKSDSTLYKFTRTNASGAFTINASDTGKYLLLVTYPRFADFVDEISLDGQTRELGILPLIQKSALLEEVIVKQSWSIRLKGDTIEYKADSFKVAEGASVKDLLKRLPGLQVDKNGKITAHGETVDKVLVDGEEFFTDDPAVVIENLRADAIDKVQAYDKKSDQAEFTGVDDGSRSKTLNLVLKDDKKKGILGKIVAGGGTEERYSNEAMLNYFKGKKKASVYGIASNTGRMGLGWEDRGKFSGNDFEDSDVQMGAGFIMITSSMDADFEDWQSDYSGEGIPRVIKAGAHYSDKWNEDKRRVNGNYSHKDSRVLGKGNSLYKYILPDSAYYLKEYHTSSTQERDHLFTGFYDMKFDSLSSVRIRVNGRILQKETISGTNTETDNEELMAVNRNARTNSNNTETKTFQAEALWRQKFNKKGRTISLSVSQKHQEKESDGYLFSRTEFFDQNGNTLNVDTIDQYKTGFSKVISTNSKLVYTEPVGKKGILEFNYTFQRVSNTLDRQSFDESGGKYTSRNDLFSVRYGLLYLSNSGGVKYQYNGKKLGVNIGTNLGFADYRQKDSAGQQIRHLTYTNLFPASRITYMFTSQRRLTLNYSGTPQPPSIEQIQPTRENTNPLFIVKGNPDLEQAFRHNLSLTFSDYKILTSRSIWLNGSYGRTQNAIVTSQTVNSGITTQEYINTNGNFYYNLYGSWGKELKKPDIYVGFTVSSNGNNFVNFVNGQKSISRNRSYGTELVIGKYEENEYEIDIRPEFRYNRSTSSINTVKSNFWTQNYDISASYYLTKRFIVESDVEFALRQKTDAFTGDNNFTIWNAAVVYKVFKKNNGELKLECNDILKQRRGFNRMFTSNYLYEKNYNVLGQYFMLSFTWNFTKSPATK